MDSKVYIPRSEIPKSQDRHRFSAARYHQSVLQSDYIRFTFPVAQCESCHCSILWQTPSINTVIIDTTSKIVIGLEVPGRALGKNTCSVQPNAVLQCCDALSVIRCIVMCPLIYDVRKVVPYHTIAKVYQILNSNVSLCIDYWLEDYCLVPLLKLSLFWWICMQRYFV